MQVGEGERVGEGDVRCKGEGAEDEAFRVEEGGAEAEVVAFGEEVGGVIGGGRAGSRAGM